MGLQADANAASGGHVSADTAGEDDAAAVDAGSAEDHAISVVADEDKDKDDDDLWGFPQWVCARCKSCKHSHPSRDGLRCSCQRKVPILFYCFYTRISTDSDHQC